MKFKNNISLKAGLSYAIVAIDMILIIALVYVNTRSLNAISTSVGEYARMQQHADSALAGMMADERESLQQLNEAMALSRRPGALRRRMDSLNSGKDSVVVHSKATETHHVSTTTVEVARSRRGFFHRLADLFHSSHSDTVSVRRDSTLAGVDTVARPVDVSHRVASILADAEREDHKMAQHDAVSVNSEMRYLKALTDAIAREQARKVTLLQAQERKIVSRSLADARRAQERLVMQLALLAAIAILLGAFLVWRIRRDVTREAAYRQALQEANEEIRRVMDIGKLKKIVERLHSGHNIHIHLDLIAGLPYEDYESFRHSFNDVYRMKPEQLQLGFLKVLSGSYMKEAEKQYDLLYTSYPPYEVLSTKWISYEEICRLKQVEEMVEIYYNSNQFTYTIPYLERFFDNPFDLYEALALFYEKNGYFVNTPSRMYWYDVLLQFAEEFANREIVVQLLTMDVYLRENAKSRPSFAKDLSAYKERVNHFYRMEEKHREDGSNRLKNYEDCDARMMVRQLHIEPFSYDIFGEEPTYQKLDKEVFALYDYRQRNPLTYDAEIVFLTEDEI